MERCAINALSGPFVPFNTEELPTSEGRGGLIRLLRPEY